MAVRPICKQSLLSVLPLLPPEPPCIAAIRCSNSTANTSHKCIVLADSCVSHPAAVRCTARCSSSAPLAALRAAELAHGTAKLDLKIATRTPAATPCSPQRQRQINDRPRVVWRDATSKAVRRPAGTDGLRLLEAHEALAKETLPSTKPWASCRQASKYLAVRFGLHPSSGGPSRPCPQAIRKVLLARALSARPDLVVLDNAFDGLDAPSRRPWPNAVAMSRGQGDILVRDMPSAKEAAAQLLQVTHRASKFCPVAALTWMTDEGARTEAAVHDDLEARLLAATSRKDVALSTTC